MWDESTERVEPGDGKPSDAYGAFLVAAWVHLDEGGLRPLPWYLARFRGTDTAIATEWLALRRQTESTSDDDRPYVGRYRLLTEIGRGGQAIVHLAEDTVLGRRVALKVLEGVGPGARVALRRLEQEARITSSLEHPSICPVYEVGTSPVPFIAMRYVEGESLARMISSAVTARSDDPTLPSVVELETVPEAAPANGEWPGPITPTSGTSRDITAVLVMIEKVARALHAAHEQNVIHRDVKPGNIMVDRNGEPVLLDFGLARDVDAGGTSTLGSGAGTPPYMSPEQYLLDQVQLDRRSDVWSLGVTLYECLTLAHPFRAPTQNKLVEAITRQDPVDPRKLNRSIGSDLATVLATALAKNPDERYATALDFAEELRRVRLYEPIAARPAGPLLRLRRWSQRNRKLAVAGFAAFTILSLAAGLLLHQNATLRREYRARIVATAQKDDAERRERAALAEKQMVLDSVGRLTETSRLIETLRLAEAPSTTRQDRVDTLESWIADAKSITDRIPVHEAELARLRVSVSLADSSVVRSDRIDGLPVLRSDDLRRWQLDTLERVVPDLMDLANRMTAILANLTRRLQVARTTQRLSIEHFESPWQDAIAYSRKTDCYGELDLVPQENLIPLGLDESSKLLEFLHVSSHGDGGLPVRSADGRLIVTEQTGLVFVLLPGGAFKMGATRSAVERASDNVDPFAERQDGPVHEVVLAPFFLSKYEMTQAQWMRITGKNPSAQPAGRDIGGVTLTDVHPVENVSWTTCRDVLGSAGLDLPTEAQWEYAARAGTSTVWWSGSAREDLLGCANLADQTAKKAGATWSAIDDWPELDDGWVTHAPVDTLRPNPFGLHHVHGNVWEWCRDGVGTYRTLPRGDEGERPALEGTLRVYRGGAFSSPAYLARSAHRSFFTPETTLGNLGVRPMRLLRR